MVKEIIKHDEEYKETSVDSTTTNMAALMEEVDVLDEELAALAKIVPTLDDLYKSDTGLNNNTLTQAGKYYNDVKSIVDRINKICEDANKILKNFNVFHIDTIDRIAAESSVNSIEKLKIKIYIAAAKGLANLVINMSTSATIAINEATYIGDQITGAVISTTGSSQQSQQFNDENNFKSKKEIFDKANTGYESIYKNLNVFIGTCDTYLKEVPDTVLGKKYDMDELKKAKEGRKKLLNDYGAVLNLTNKITELQKYLDDVNKKFGEIETLKTEAATLLNNLEEAKKKGIKAFETHNMVVNQVSSTGLNDHDVTKSKADIDFGIVSGLNSEIKKKISRAKNTADEIVNGAKFEFVKTKAQQLSSELELSKNNTITLADSKFKELETKRNEVYKIGNIESLEKKSTELQLIIQKVNSFVGVIIKLGEDVERVNAEVGNINDTDLMLTGDSTLTKIIDLKSDSDAKLKKIVENKSHADAALFEIRNLDSDINTLFRNLENNPPSEFISEKDTLKQLVEQAKLDVPSIVAVHQKALDDNQKTTKMAKLYGEIKEKYDGALKLLTDFNIDEKIKEETEIRSETEVKIDQKLQQAETVRKYVMAFSDGTDLTSEQVKSIEKNYKEVTDIKTELAVMQAGNSEKEVKFTETVVRDVLEKLDKAISHIKSISTSVSSYTHLSAYYSIVLSKLETNKDLTESKKTKNKKQSDALTLKIKTAIDTADQYITEMETRISKLKVSPKTHTCNTVGNEFTFSRDKLSGRDNEKIEISGGGKTATQIQPSYIKCLWLTTNQGIPTDCTVPVTWAIKITTSDVTNLKDMLMGVGIDTFNPFAKDSGSGIKDCNVIPGFWGFSGAKTYINGVEYNESNSFLNIDNKVFFTLSPVALAVSSSSKKFNLYMVYGNYHSNTIELTVPDSTNNLYPIVRFKSQDDEYTFMDVDSNLSMLINSGNFTASADASADAPDAPVPVPAADAQAKADAQAAAEAQRLRDAQAAAADAKAVAEAPVADAQVNIDDAVLSGWYITENSNNIMFMVYYRGNNKYDVSLYGWSASLNKVVGSGYFFTISTNEFKIFKENINRISGTAYTMTIDLDGTSKQIPGKWQKNNPDNSSAGRTMVSFSRRATKYKKNVVDKIIVHLNKLLEEDDNEKYGWIPYYVDKNEDGYIETMATKEYDTFDGVSKINIKCYNAGIRVSEYGVTRKTRDKDSTEQKFRIWVIPELVEVDEEKKRVEKNIQAADVDASIEYYLDDIKGNPSDYKHYKDYIKENFPLYNDAAINHMTILLDRRRAERLISGLEQNPNHNALLAALVEKIKTFIKPENSLFIQRLDYIFGDGTVKHGSDDAILEYTLKQTFDVKGDADKHIGSIISSIISKLTSSQTSSQMLLEKSLEKSLEKLLEDIHDKMYVYNNPGDKQGDNKWYITIMDPLVVLNKLEEVLVLPNAGSSPAAVPASATPIKIEAVQAFAKKGYSIMDRTTGVPSGVPPLTKAFVSCPNRILDSFRKIIKKSQIPGMACDNPYAAVGDKSKITFPTKAENFGAKDLQVIARNESINTDGIMNIDLYNNALSVKEIGTIRCLVKGTTVAGLTYPIQTGKDTKTVLPTPKLAIVIDQSGLQWQFSIYNTGALFFYIDLRRHKLTDNIQQGTTTFTDKQITIGEYIQWQKDMYKVMYGVIRPQKPTNPQKFTFTPGTPGFVLNGFMGDDLKLGFKTEFLQAFHAVHNISKKDDSITDIEFRFLKAGMGFFSQCITLASNTKDKKHIAKSRLEGIIDAINELEHDNIIKHTKIRSVTLPYLTDKDDNGIELDEKNKFTELLALSKNIHLANFLFNSGQIDAFATPADSKVTLATTNCGDPHAMTGNEGNNDSTDALLVMNAYLHHLNSAFNYDHVIDDIYNNENDLGSASDDIFPAPVLAPNISLKQMYDNNFTSDKLRQAGFPSNEELGNQNFDETFLKSQGFNDSAINHFIAAATCKNIDNIELLKYNNVNAKEARAVGFSADELTRVGFSGAALKTAGFSLQDLKLLDFTALELKDAGFTAAQLKEALFTAAQLKEAGFSIQELMGANFKTSDILKARFPVAVLKAAGLDVIKLLGDLENIKPAEMRTAGFTASDLKEGTIPIKQIVNAGYNDEELEAEGITKPGFFSKIFSSKKGGKSGSSITRKRRLRLKKSRNITRHKGGKKSVRFSARVKLNNGNGNGKGNGKGNGTSSMNKRTRKVSSSSYKLSARRVIKLKR